MTRADYSALEGRCWSWPIVFNDVQIGEAVVKIIDGRPQVISANIDFATNIDSVMNIVGNLSDTEADIHEEPPGSLDGPLPWETRFGLWLIRIFRR